MADLCLLEDLKDWLSITDTSQDAALNRLISATSDDFLNQIQRPDFAPAVDYTEYIWNTKDHRHLSFEPIWRKRRHQEIWLKHYPVNSITSVTINGETIIAVTDPSDTDSSGYWFDEEAADEDRQKIVLVDQAFISPFRATVEYNAGYDEIPQGVQQAIIEWVSLKRGIGQIQRQDQSGGSVSAGTVTYSGDNIDMTVTAMTADLPVNVANVIAQYRRLSV